MWGRWFKIQQLFFKILVQKYPNKAFLLPNLGIFFPWKILQFDKFEGADFKYDNSFLKFYPKNYPNKAILVSNLGIFVFSKKFAIRQIWGVWFQIWQ